MHTDVKLASPLRNEMGIVSVKQPLLDNVDLTAVLCRPDDEADGRKEKERT